MTLQLLLSTLLAHTLQRPTTDAFALWSQPLLSHANCGISVADWPLGQAWPALHSLNAQEHLTALPARL